MDGLNAPKSSHLSVGIQATPTAAGPYALVVLDRSQSGLEKELTYGVPDELHGTLRIGFSVLVPFGRKLVTGYITGFAATIDFDVKSLRCIERVNSTVAIFDRRALQIARWMSSYYHCTLADCIACFVPQGATHESQKKYAATPLAHDAAARASLSRAPKQSRILDHLLAAPAPQTVKELERHLKIGTVREALAKLVATSLVTEEEELLDPTVKPKILQAVRLKAGGLAEPDQLAALRKLAPRQAEALEKLHNLQISAVGDGPPKEARRALPESELMAVPTLQLAHDWSIDLTALRALEKKGLVEFTTLQQRRAPMPHMPPRDVARVDLSAEQSAAVVAINGMLENSATAPTSPSPRTLLLHGVTAGGKTEVYLHAIEKCLQMGRRALVLVPEIALTAQTVETFQRRFQERVAILHSALSSGERFDEWRRARSGKADIVVGARSAIFAPCRNLGLIVIDEEHDGSYKQDQAPRYHARDLALKRAALENAVVVLGSATPCLESYHHARRGDYAYARILHRVAARPLPEIHIVDMTEEARMGALPVLSGPLTSALCDTVARGEQAILFLNRRGFAVYVQCLSCGHVERCPNCDVALTFHRHEKTLRCHHCDHIAPVIEACPQCQGCMIGFSGTGTEKVESEVMQLLARRGLDKVRTLRLDRDTTMRKGAHGKILGEFRQGRAQILIGTQMVTKGLDFPNVTLVGVIAADSALNMPDFRAAERTFQLLCQVAGRAGRGERPGHVYVQTLAVDHFAVEAARAQDYELFVNQELEFRRTPQYPPFAYVVNIISHDENMNEAKMRLQRLASALSDAIATEGGGTELLGPVDCLVSRVKNRFRFHLMLRDRNRPRLHRVLRVYDALPREVRAGLIIDVDAMSLL